MKLSRSDLLGALAFHLACWFFVLYGAKLHTWVTW